MSEYTQQEIDHLLKCPKVVIEPPRKQMVEERGSRRNNMRLTSEDGKIKFEAFMRICEDFPENFSIGLSYCPEDGSGNICLIRCNGPHEGFSDNPNEKRQHFGFHIHTAKADNIEAGLKAEKGAERTHAYASYRDALRWFVKECNIKNADQHFPNELKKTLFDDV